MAVTEMVSIQPPNDPEIDICVRETLDYYIVFPDGYDKTKKYGLVFCISGYGDSAASEYQMNKLRPYISDKYNMITVGVRYHNDVRNCNEYELDSNSICNWYGLTSDFFKDASDGNEMFDKIYNLLAARGVFSLDPRLAVKAGTYHKYSSFGFMPAIDHLWVLYDILQKYNIDKQNIISFGTSYGGYVSLLMGKYAPHTFSLIIDNSGFCNAQLNEVFGGIVGGTAGSFPRYIDNKRYEIPIVSKTLWSIDETSKYYFSDAHKEIRNLLLEKHRTPSETMYCCYHSTQDVIASVELKDRMCSILGKYNPVYFKKIDERDVDGKVFKNLSHGMNASLRSLFDISMEVYKKANIVKENKTDFDDNVTYGFPCSDKLYNFSYSGKGIEVHIDTTNSL